MTWVDRGGDVWELFGGRVAIAGRSKFGWEMLYYVYSGTRNVGAAATLEEAKEMALAELPELLQLALLSGETR